MSLPSNLVHYWYEQGFNYGYNQMTIVDASPFYNQYPTSMPSNVPAQYQYAFLEGEDAGMDDSPGF